MPRTHEVTVFEEARVTVHSYETCGSISAAVNYVPPGRLKNVRFELEVTWGERCFIVCTDTNPILCNAKVKGTEVVDGVETPTVFLTASKPYWHTIYSASTPNLPHLIEVEFCKALEGDLGAHGIRFNLVLIYTYELEGSLSIRAFRDGAEVNVWCEIVDVTTGYTPFYISLDPGVYTVNCTYEEETKTETVEVKEEELTEVTFKFVAPPPEEIWVHLRCVGVASAQCLVVHDPYSETITVPSDFTVSPAGDWTFRAIGENFDYWMVNGVKMDAREITLTLELPSETTLTMYFKAPPTPPPSISDVAMALGILSAVISIGGLIYSGVTYFME